MIVGLDDREPRDVRLWGDDESAAAREWCYLRRTRSIYEINGRRVVGAVPSVARQRVLERGRLLCTGRHAPKQLTSAAARDRRERERRAARRAEDRTRGDA